MVTLITGGAASGKSLLAEKLTCSLGRRKAYLATMLVSDGETRARVARHRALRSGKGFDTFECPIFLPCNAFSGKYDCVLLECMSNLLANVMFSRGMSGADAAGMICGELHGLFRAVPNTVVVTNEVFSDGTAYSIQTLEYIKALGEINVRAAAMSDAVVESVCGMPVVYKGAKELAKICPELLNP
jgi:adenosylcobinamide kinase/adenosylcobinamide-phosphate guanylyltransferase